MATMSPAERARCFAQTMREIGWGDITKPELREAVDAADDWIDAASSNYNAALPVAFRTKATPGQKAFLLAMVIMRRVGRLRAEED